MQQTCHLVALLALLLTFPAFAADESLFGAVRENVDEQYADLEKLYKHFHTHPELSYFEEATSRRMAQEWKKLGFDVTENVGGFGVVAVMKNGEGPTIMVRADTDALPVKEETGLDYASTVTTDDSLGVNVPVMHACGHDVHMTSIIGAARVLVDMKDSWSGTLVMIAQPAEERGGGARAMLADGLFEKFPRPDAAIALHVHPELQSGTIGYVKGYAMANVDSVDIKIRGVGGHGAYPHKTKDPIVIAAQVIMGLQTIVSRELAPTDPAVVTVGSIHGGTKHNIISNEVDMQLTVRSYSDETRDHLMASIERITKNTARAAGVPPFAMPTVELREEYTPALYNSPDLVDRVNGAFSNLLGEANIVELGPVMGGEDFGRYGREEPHVPIFMYRLGTISAERIAATDKEGAQPLPSMHSSKYYPEPEPTLKTGAQTLAVAVLELMREN
jgi:hippurate hydrolase